MQRTATNYVSQRPANENARSGNQEPRRFHVGHLIKVLLISTAFLVATPLIAQAHTSLISSNPEDKSTIEQFPKAISLEFNSLLMKIGDKETSKITIHNPKHKILKIDGLVADGTKMTANIANSDYISGTYKVYYRVISADGHPVSGIIKFNYKSASATNEIEVISSNSLDDIKHWIIHHKWHILETFLALILILAWAIYRRKNHSE